MPERGEIGKEIPDQSAKEKVIDLALTLAEGGGTYRADLFLLMEKLLDAPNFDARQELIKSSNFDEIDIAETDPDSDSLVADLILSYKDNKIMDPEEVAFLKEVIQDAKETESVTLTNIENVKDEEVKPVETPTPDEGAQEVPKSDASTQPFTEQDLDRIKNIQVGAVKEKREEEFGKELTLEQSKKILDNTEVHGYPMPGEKALDALELESAGLGPKYSAEMYKKRVFFSDAMDIGFGYTVAIAYVPSGNKYIARGYYLSKSGGAVWRYLPTYDYSKVEQPEDRNKFGRFGKGWEYDGSLAAPALKNSVVAPGLMQAELSEIISTKPLATKVSADDGWTTFRRTARAIPQESTFVAVKKEKPKVIAGSFHSGDYEEKVNPADQEFAYEKDRPDYKNIIKSWTAPVYDPLTDREFIAEVDLVPSADRQTNYMFCFDRDRTRAWVGITEDGSDDITSTGLKEQWVNSGDFTTPFIERKRYADGYGTEVKGHQKKEGDLAYQDMWPNYISKMPEIKKYVHFKLTGELQEYPTGEASPDSEKDEDTQVRPRQNDRFVINLDRDASGKDIEEDWERGLSEAKRREKAKELVTDALIATHSAVIFKDPKYIPPRLKKYHLALKAIEKYGIGASGNREVLQESFKNESGKDWSKDIDLADL